MQGNELYLLLDGVLAVEVDGETVAEIGPGAILGERAVVEGGKRTATLRAVTPAKVVSVSADEVEPSALEELAGDAASEGELGAGVPDRVEHVVEAAFAEALAEPAPLDIPARAFSTS